MIKNILVPVDFSQGTSKIIDKAECFARAFDARIWLVHVTEDDPEFVGYDLGPQYIRDERAKEIREEHLHLQQLSNVLRQKNIETEPLLLQGEAAATILQKAKNLRCDLIVIGKHGSGGIFDVLMGSVSRQVVNGANVPVLLVPVKND